jgi:hypothetical protein
MADLANLRFTKGSDIYSDETLFLGNADADTLGGNDSLTAKLPSGSIFKQTFSISDGVLKTGDGNDEITGDGGSGFQCNGITLGSLGTRSTGIETGSGNDRITGIGSGGGAGGFGIANFSSTIDTGSGNDLIIGRSGAKNLGIYNFDRIEMGSGNDLIIASGIINGGLISMGSGNDIIRVESSEGYQDGGGIELGTGNDIVSGINSGSIEGSSGTDRVLLRAGRYEITKTDGGYQVGGSLLLSGIEGIGATQSQFFVPLQAGVLEISSNGSVAYV